MGLPLATLAGVTVVVAPVLVLVSSERAARPTPGMRG